MRSCPGRLAAEGPEEPAGPVVGALVGVGLVVGVMWAGGRVIRLVRDRH
ncbi:hypothetical protein [Nocardiopsis sp. CC223A]|nr:hypothetical protein [Nocardiopsis sp. CC223A]